MNSTKLFSAAIAMALLSLMVGPGSDATIITPLHVFTAAKLGTMALLGKGAIIGGIAVPLIAKKVLLGKVAAVGGLAGIKGGIIGASLKAPLLLAKSSLPNVLSLAPLLKGIGKKGKGKSVAAAAPLPPPAAPAYPAPAAPAYSAPAAPAYPVPAAPAYPVPMAPVYSPSYGPAVRSGY